MKRVADLLAGFEALPLADAGTILQGRKAVILAPHPDDESLGCGGLIAAACATGNPPLVVILTDGAASHPGSLAYPPERLARLREAETIKAMTCLGLPESALMCMRYSDTRLGIMWPQIHLEVEKLWRTLQRENVQIIIGPWIGDPHGDHEAAAMIAADLALHAALPLLSYPVWGWLRRGDDLVNEPRIHGWRLDISPYLQSKRDAIAAHRSQFGDLITDSPRGFRLPADLLAIFARNYEVFISV